MKFIDINDGQIFINAEYYIGLFYVEDSTYEHRWIENGSVMGQVTNNNRVVVVTF